MNANKRECLLNWRVKPEQALPLPAYRNRAGNASLMSACNLQRTRTQDVPCAQPGFNLTNSGLLVGATHPDRIQTFAFICGLMPSVSFTVLRLYVEKRVFVHAD
jgi:hypothetical protein